MVDIENNGHDVHANRGGIPFTSGIHQQISDLEENVFLPEYEANPTDDKIRKLADRGGQTKTAALEITEWANINNGVGFSNSLTDKQKYIKDMMLKQENVEAFWEENVLKFKMPNEDGSELIIGNEDLQEISGQVIPQDVQLDVDTTALNVKEAAEQDNEIWDNQYREKLKRSINITPDNITRIFWELKLGNGSAVHEVLQDHPDFSNTGVELEFSKNDKISMIKEIGTKENLTKNIDYWKNEIKEAIVNGLFLPNFKKGKKLAKKTKPNKYVG